MILTLPCLALAVALQQPPPIEEPKGDRARPTIAGEWTQWRGPSRDGRIAGPAWPDGVGEDSLRRLWTVESLGPSYSGPIVDGERVYTTESTKLGDEVVHAFDRATGERVWRQSWKGSMSVPFFALRNGSWIRSTPALADGALFVAGMCDRLVCLEAETGDVRWTVDFLERFDTELPPFGLVCSPLVDEGAVYIQASDALVKLDARDGSTTWRTLVEERDEMSGGAFSSPILTELGGRRQLLVQTRDELTGVAPDTGEVLWRLAVPAFRGMNILTPTRLGERVYTSSYGGKSLCLDVRQVDGAWTVEPAWQSRVQAYMSTPVVVGSHAYMWNRANRFFCFDIETGTEAWTSPATGDDYWSLVVGQERILALSERGMLRALRADPDGYHLEAQWQVSESECWAHLATAGDQVFVRSLDALHAFEWKR